MQDADYGTLFALFLLDVGYDTMILHYYDVMVRYLR